MIWFVVIGLGVAAAVTLFAIDELVAIIFEWHRGS